MHARLDTRLRHLERQARARNAPLGHEVHAAVERLRGHAVATLKAVLHRQDPPARDEVQAQADTVLFTRWCREHGTYVDLDGGARTRLQATLKTIAARQAADPLGVWRSATVDSASIDRSC
jgi:hypothetical protein